MLDNVEGAIKHGQSRETSNLGYTRHRTKTYKTKTIIQYVLDTTIYKTQDDISDFKTICFKKNQKIPRPNSKRKLQNVVNGKVTITKLEIFC
jgi:hypothetical protein